VEVDVDFRLALDNSTLIANVHTSLYEGTSCSTADREDSWAGTVIIPKGEIGEVNARLVNAGAGGGDSADILFTILNGPA
jgi:hypothetical protein